MSCLRSLSRPCLDCSSTPSASSSPPACSASCRPLLLTQALSPAAAVGVAEEPPPPSPPTPTPLLLVAVCRLLTAAPDSIEAPCGVGAVTSTALVLLAREEPGPADTGVGWLLLHALLLLGCAGPPPPPTLAAPAAAEEPPAVTEAGKPWSSSCSRRMVSSNNAPTPPCCCCCRCCCCDFAGVPLLPSSLTPPPATPPEPFVAARSRCLRTLTPPPNSRSGSCSTGGVGARSSGC